MKFAAILLITVMPIPSMMGLRATHSTCPKATITANVSSMAGKTRGRPWTYELDPALVYVIEEE